MLPYRVETGEVDGGTETCAQGGREGTTPEGGDDTARRGADLGECGTQGVRAAGLLDSSFEQVNWLEENGREDTRPEARDEVEGCFV